MVPVLLVRTNATRDSVREGLAETLAPAQEHIRLHAVTPVGPPFTRYATMGDGSIGLEAGLQLPRGLPEVSGIIAAELPAGEAVSTIHVGPYSQLWAAYEAVTYWMENSRRTPAGEPWEVYLKGHREQPDPALWQTEIVWPLSAAVKL
ncbi:MAG: GyrI-like domain-containing protein [Chloroflexi bacterium]|nr:GyrI-like domain-containing protein [Chloroflexota bacterium]